MPGPTFPIAPGSKRGLAIAVMSQSGPPIPPKRPLFRREGQERSASPLVRVGSEAGSENSAPEKQAVGAPSEGLRLTRAARAAASARSLTTAAIHFFHSMTPTDSKEEPQHRRSQGPTVWPLDLLAMALLAGSFGLIPWILPVLGQAPLGGLLIVLAAAGACVAAITAHHRLGSPPLYWSGYDLAALGFFTWIGASIHLGEVPEATWLKAPLIACNLAAWLVGRLTGWRRFALLCWMFVGGCLIAAFGHEATTPLAPGLIESGVDLGLLTGRFGGGGPAFLIMAVVLGLCVFLFQTIRRPPAGMGGLLVLCCLGFAAILIYPLVLGFEDQDETRRLLTEGWRQSFALFQNYPLAGVGYGAWGTVAMAWSHGRGVIPPPAGDFTVVLLELGIPGLLLLAGLWFLLPWSAWQARHTYPFRRMRLAVGLIQAALVLLALLAFVGFDIITGSLSVLFWALIGTLAGMVQIRDPARAFGDSQIVMGPAKKAAWISTGLRLGITAAVLFLSALPSVGFFIAGNSPPAPEQIRRLERAVALFPQSADLQMRLAESLQMQTRQSGLLIPDVLTAAKVDNALQAAIRGNPYRPANHEALYYWHRDSNDPDRALATIRSGVRYNPASLELRLLLVRELERNGSLALATHHLKQAALRSTGPNQATLMLQLAEIYEQRGLREQARRWWQYAQQIEDPSAQTQSRLRRLGERLALLDPQAGPR